MTIEDAYKEAERLVGGVFDTMSDEIRSTTRVDSRDVRGTNEVDLFVLRRKDAIVRTIAERLMERPL